jgi:DNA (cytosine-5)-methyltransferase 1
MASARRKRPIAIDLFAGAGGFSLGFEQAGFDVVGAVEIDPIHAATHEFNFPRCKVMCRDAATLTGEEIRASLGLGFDDIDVVFGGAPCQGFSLMGKRGLDDPRNRLVNHFVRLVLELSPRYFVFENVYGLTVGKHRAFLEALMDEFEDEGYNVVHDYRVLDASAFGVPQKRKRLFMLGGKSGLTHPDYPEPITVPADEPILENFNGLKHGPSVWDAISDLPNVDEFPALLASDSVRVKLKKASQYAQVLRGEVREENDFSYRRSHDASLLTSSLRTVHTNDSIVRFNRTGPGQVESISHYYRLDPNGVCNTLRAGTASDRGAFTSPRPIHPVHNRCITVREAARLHSYPDWFRFHVTKWHGFRQIGNSVPPYLGRAVATRIREALGTEVISPRHILTLGPESLLMLGMGDAAEHSEVPSYVVAKRRRARDIKMTNENSTPPPAENVDIYVPIIRHIFQQHFKPKLKQFVFERKEIELAAKALKIVLPANKGDVVYSFRYRKNLPPEILQTAPRGFEWIIEGAGRSRYRFRLSRASRIVPRRNQHQIKIPNATPEIITAYATTDEQALLAKVRYNRLIDIFLGITTYSLQSHLRTQVKGIGQILIDEMYIGVSQSGAQYVIPVQAKGSNDMIGVVRARQDFLYCKERYPNLECRVVAVQAVEGDAIAMFELTLQDDDVRVRDERHYKLVPQDQISVKDLQEFRRAVSAR